jgi:hypothetical protein
VVVDNRTVVVDTRAVVVDTRAVIVDTRTVIVDTRGMIVDTRAVIVDTRAGVAASAAGVAASPHAEREPDRERALSVSLRNPLRGPPGRLGPNFCPPSCILFHFVVYSYYHALFEGVPGYAAHNER